MTRFNPYLWIGIIVILSLILLSVLRTWLKASVVRGRAAIVSVSVVQNLAQNLSVDGVDVFKWVWRHEEGPVTIGDLLSTRDQIRSGRVRKLAMARAQHRALEEALAAKPAHLAAPRQEQGASSLEPKLEPELKPAPKPEATDESIPTLRATQ
jgi:drug/metabolite transporter superfamily protein YnfA